MLLFAFSACSYKTPPAVTPPPNDQNVEKTQFRTANGTAKTFMCAWAPISETGEIAQGTQVHQAASLPACNVQFLIERDVLVGKQVNPSVPAKDWATVITIPITEHFNYEAAKDKYDRPTKEFIRNTSRDNWNARGSMTLDFGGMAIHDFAYELLYDGTSIQSVSDVEQTTHNGKTFIGFTISASSPKWGRHNQAQFRVNFLEIDPGSTKDFTPRLYHEDNSNHFGAIWGMGKQIEGLNPVKFVARWDFSPKNLPYEFCLNGFEGQDLARQVAVDSLEEWNRILVDAEIVPAGTKAFTVSKRTYPHGFDLRCPSINYVADRRISENSPLGIAMAQADVSTGKILWGAMAVYGGALEAYIEHYRGSSRIAGLSKLATWSAKMGQSLLGANPLQLMNSAQPEVFGSRSPRPTPQMQQEMRQFIGHAQANSINKFMLNLRDEGVNVSGIQELLAKGQLSSLREALRPDRPEAEKSALAKSLAVKPEELKKISTDLARLLDGLQNAQSATQNELDARITDSLGQLQRIGQEAARSSSVNLDAAGRAKLFLGTNVARNDSLVSEAIFGDNWQQLSNEQKQGNLLSKMQNAYKRNYQSNIQDMDFTIGDFVAPLSNLPPDLQDKSIDDILRVTLKKTILHEFGHVFGLAHNFKENIMPKPGSIPAKYIKELEEARDRPYNQNYTTIMGYPHSFQMLVRSYDAVKLGKMDELVLRYIYNNQYPVYNGKDADFSYRQVPGDGRIPERTADLGDNYKVAYFPSCTDYMEIFGLDPYCNRWDRGYDAKTIAEGLISDYENNWVKKFTNLVDTGSDPNWATYSQWSRSIYTFSKLRKFYDHMRYNYRKEIQTIANQNKDNLYSFSKCNGEQQSNQFIRDVFTKADPEFAELCEVNRTVVDKLAAYLRDPGPDFTTYDNNNAAIPVGEVGNDSYQSWSRMDGTWKELGVLPMKYSSILTLTSPVPYWSYGPYLIPVWKYARPGENTKYTYASLYPYEFTRGISEGVKANLKFNAIDGTNPQMGRIALFMGSFLGDTFSYWDSTNDYHVFDKNYMNTIRNQSRFIFDPEYPFVPVIIEAVRSKDTNEDPDRVKSFLAQVYVWGEKPVSLGDAYMLPEGKVFFRYSPQMFVHPISDVFFINDDIAVVWGIRVQYSVDRYSNLGVHGLKQQLYTQYQRVIDSCIEEAKLREFFKKGNKDFKGFKIIPGIAGNENRYQTFVDSVQAEFDKYWAHPQYGNNDLSKRDVCSKALDDVGLIVTQALVTQGYWMPSITEYLLK